MSAQVIDFRTGRLLASDANLTPVPAITADAAVQEARSLVEDAFGLSRSPRVQAALVEVDALLEGLADALASWVPQEVRQA